MNPQLKNVQHDFEVDIGGVGVTVRLGPKWAGVPVGATVDLWQCARPHAGDCPAPLNGDHTGSDAGCVARGQARILGYWCGALADLPRGLLALEHEVASRTRDGLRASLERAYGAARVAPDVEVTALIYLRTVLP